jgi:hypothetical protein
MSDAIGYLSPGPDLSTWPGLFEAADLDYVPDPMVLRAAELFIGGRQHCRQNQQLDDEKAWPIIERNIDGILAFFHVLMTRERVPLIDYDMTFPADVFRSLIGEIALDVHPDHGLYQRFKAEGLEKLASFDAGKLPEGLAANLGQELATIGYGWAPDVSGLGLKTKAEEDAAGFILGGLIFGAYADASGSDHLLQNKRAQMFVALVGAAPAPTPGVARERRLFAALNQATNQDERFKVEQERAPPTVLHHLLAQGVDNTRQLLDETLLLRDSAAGRGYRKWHGKLRKAWRGGRHDQAAEAELEAVTVELERRLSGKPTVLTRLTVKGTAKASVKGDVGIAKAGVEVGVTAERDKIDVVFPERLRNWWIDNVRFARHQKLLLEMSFDRRSFDDLALGLRTVWNRS